MRELRGPQHWVAGTSLLTAKMTSKWLVCSKEYITARERSSAVRVDGLVGLSAPTPESVPHSAVSYGRVRVSSSSSTGCG